MGTSATRERLPAARPQARDNAPVPACCPPIALPGAAAMVPCRPAQRSAKVAASLSAPSGVLRTCTNSSSCVSLLWPPGSAASNAAAHASACDATVGMAGTRGRAQRRRDPAKCTTAKTQVACVSGQRPALTPSVPHGTDGATRQSARTHALLTTSPPPPTKAPLVTAPRTDTK